METYKIIVHHFIFEFGKAKVPNSILFQTKEKLNKNYKSKLESVTSPVW